jgi:hypothetical protein
MVGLYLKVAEKGLKVALEHLVFDAPDRALRPGPGSHH